MRSPTARRLLLAVTAALAASTATAHDTWVLPRQFTVRAGSSVAVELTSAMQFPSSESVVKAERIAKSGLRVAGETSALGVGRATAASLRLAGRAGREGVATAWLELRPRTLTLTDAQVEEYLHEIGAWETAGREWRDSGRRPWKETYVKCAAAFVGVGEGAADTSWSQPVGLALEIVPETDPTRLARGQELAVRLLRRGAPLRGHPVAAQAAGGKAVLAKTDDDGRVRFVLDREGPWLLKSTSLRRLESGDWESEFATATLAVRAAIP